MLENPYILGGILGILIYLVIKEGIEVIPEIIDDYKNGRY